MNVTKYYDTLIWCVLAVGRGSNTLGGEFCQNVFKEWFNEFFTLQMNLACSPEPLQELHVEYWWDFCSVLGFSFFGHMLLMLMLVI